MIMVITGQLVWHQSQAQ